ncbi:ThuA domain-containing protein [Allorhodopirellula solitaria]|uniref:Trehalose utilization n=1 Tax=Allorhodopirellula solitaria TaxID=2527987 RepID=A0A5C5XQ10_9BACT|nr:ThuA domain-containing protein [Allorhodopirellula solitaria]TWT65000.1 Trehalose utilization [Allorhodopirellula solitaria]
MNTIPSIALSLLLASVTLAAESPIPIVFDTDIDTDCDDVGAVACLHALADADEIEILATTVSSNFPYSAPCLDALNRYYGRPSIPLGTPKHGGASVHRGSRYAAQIASRFPSRFQANDDAPSAVTVLRSALAEADDDSVRLVTVGYLTNIADLLRSPADDISPLSGRELAQLKVSHLVVMGGRYPEHLDPAEFGNLKPDPGSAVEVAGRWPGTIYFSGLGADVGTGSQRHTLHKNNPLRIAYDLYLGDKPTRSSWDQVALLFAVRPGAPYWSVQSEGGNKIYPNGTNRWVEEDAHDHRLVTFAEGQRGKVEAEIERLMSLERRPKQVLFVVGPSTHPPGSHEVAAGAQLMAYCLEHADNVSDIRTTVVEGWPDDEDLLKQTDVIVFSGDTFPPQRLPETDRILARIDRMMRRGCGIVCVHYATALLGKDVAPDGAHPLLGWMGGYFANKTCPHHPGIARVYQAATIEPAAPEHPISRGWSEFTLHDEPYINNYFGKNDNLPADNVTPLATSMLPPEDPQVEIVAWCVERERGRGFGIVMPHFYRNWKDEDLRRCILNGIVWTANSEVPDEGVRTTLPDLSTFDPAAVESKR